MSTSVWQLIIGVLCVAGGIAVIVYRVPLAAALARELDNAGARASAHASTPGWIAFGGGSLCVIASIIAINGLVRL